MKYVLFVCNHNAGRSHVLTLAHRQTRDCLRREHCDAALVTLTRS